MQIENIYPYGYFVKNNNIALGIGIAWNRSEVQTIGAIQNVLALSIGFYKYEFHVGIKFTSYID